MSLDIPVWVGFGLCAAVILSVTYLVQDQMKIRGFSLAFMNKLCIFSITLPVILWLGMPEDPLFYAIIFAQAILWTITDVILFDTVSKVGAGVVTRIMPLNVILTFLIWLAWDPSLVNEYAQKPITTAAIFTSICLAAFFASRLRHCEQSWTGMKALWFVMVATSFGGVFAKIIAGYADPIQGAIAFVNIEALAMVLYWAIYYAFRRPVPLKEVFSSRVFKAAFIISCLSATAIALSFLGLFYAENPAYVTVLKFLASVIVIIYYKVMGKDEKSDVLSGMGIVFCAAALILLKSV